MRENKLRETPDSASPPGRPSRLGGEAISLGFGQKSLLAHLGDTPRSMRVGEHESILSVRTVNVDGSFPDGGIRRSRSFHRRIWTYVTVTSPCREPYVVPQDESGGPTMAFRIGKFFLLPKTVDTMLYVDPLGSFRRDANRRRVAGRTIWAPEVAQMGDSGCVRPVGSSLH